MRRSMSRLASLGRASRRAAPPLLDGDALGARARQSYREAERAIEEWHAFVECHERRLLARSVRPPGRAPS
jgi:hypothetical protein